MAGTVDAYNMTLVSLCNVTTGWTAVGGTNGLNDTTVFDAREGSNCMQNYSASATSRGSDFTYGTDQTLTNKTIYFWFATSKVAGIPNVGSTGMRIRIEDSSTNWAEWDIFGGDTLPHGGWICWAVNPGTDSSTASRDGGTAPTLTTIRKIGWRCGGTVAGKTYIYWDAVRFGDGLQISAGTAGSPATFEDFNTSEVTNAYGVVNKYKGVYFVQGKLLIGSSSVATYFKDIGSTLVFQNAKVPANTFSILSLGNGSFDTEIYFGSKSGTSGIQGCSFQRESPTQTAYYDVNLSDSTRTKIGLYGSRFRRAGTVTLPPYNASYAREVINCAFEACLKLSANSCPIRNTNFISTNDTSAALLWNESIDIQNCNFIGNTTGAGIEMPSAAGSPYAYNALFFSGNTYDANNTSGSAITINKNQLSDPVTYTGSAVTFAGTSVITQITVTDIDTGNVIVGARVLVLVANGVNFPYQASVSEIVGSGTTATVTHDSHGLKTGDNVLIEGAVEQVYNGAYPITYISTNSYSYTTAETIGSSPATGTIKSTLALINADTNGSGIASDQRSMANNQPITGKVRLATGVYYKQAPISDTIDKNTGKSINVQLIPDI
jgi:hypothetical protein